MRSIKSAALAALLAGAFLMNGAQALDNTVKPEFTDRLEKVPEVALLIGNSYSFYNCGVHTYLRGMMRASTPKLGMKTRLLTISSGSLSFHDIDFYLKPHEQDPYADVNDKGELKHPMFDIVLLQENSAGATSAKRLPFFEKYAVAQADAVRKAGSTPLLIMTWPRKDKPADIEKLADNTIRIGNKAQMRVIPVGLAFMEAIKAKPDLEMYQPDKSHPSAAGSYLYGAVLYASLFGKNPTPVNYLGECEKPLSEETAAFLRDIAWKTVTEFYGWK